MSNLYLPEGRLLHTPENQAAWETLSSLRQAMEQETVLEGRAVLCTPGHDLLVNLGPFTGTIPREEAALGIREGTAREIAILSRVGKPISFTVTGVAEGAPPNSPSPAAGPRSWLWQNCSAARRAPFSPPP